MKKIFLLITIFTSLSISSAMAYEEINLNLSDNIQNTIDLSYETPQTIQENDDKVAIQTPIHPTYIEHESDSQNQTFF